MKMDVEMDVEMDRDMDTGEPAMSRIIKGEGSHLLQPWSAMDLLERCEERPARQKKKCELRRVPCGKEDVREITCCFHMVTMFSFFSCAWAGWR